MGVTRWRPEDRDQCVHAEVSEQVYSQLIVQTHSSNVLSQGSCRPSLGVAASRPKSQQLVAKAADWTHPK